MKCYLRNFLTIKNGIGLDILASITDSPDGIFLAGIVLVVIISILIIVVHIIKGKLGGENEDSKDDKKKEEDKKEDEVKHTGYNDIDTDKLIEAQLANAKTTDVPASPNADANKSKTEYTEKEVNNAKSFFDMYKPASNPNTNKKTDV